MKTHPFDAAHNLEELERLLGQVESVNALPHETLFSKAPAISSWNAVEHSFHLILVCDLSFRNVVSLARDKGRLIRDPEDRRADSIDILRRGRIPRGVSSAPRFVQPPTRVDLDLLRTLTGEVQEARSGLANDLEALERAPRVIPHQLLGDLNACEWVRFARIHSAHHLVILHEVLEA